MYKRLPRIYQAFSLAQDVSNKVVKHIIGLLAGHDLETAVEIGIGAGRHLTRLAPFFKRYVAVEPSESLINLIGKPLPSNVTIIQARFPEGVSEMQDCDAMFSFWADIPIHQYVQHAERLGATNAFWVMNGTAGEFSQLWPEGARKAWIRRADWLQRQGLCGPTSTLR